jgi:hypothetical protein
MSPETKSRVIFFLSVVIYCNSLNQSQYVLYYTECPSEGGIAEGGIVEGGILRRVVLRDVIYPCNTTLCFGERG